MNHFGSSAGKVHWILVLAILLILVGGFMAYRTKTDGGNVEVRDVRFMGSNNVMMSGLLYVPKGATAKTPAPGILAVHGYMNSRETQSCFAIEFARRGYVVLALDETAHGFSDGPAFVNGFGGPDGVRYLRSLDFVDRDNIGMEGHSMGGWAILVAASIFPNDYKSMVLEGSSTGTYGAPEGTADYPRNLRLVFSQRDEFSKLMWGVDLPKDMVDTAKLKKLFNTTEPVEIGKIYGSLEAGNARQLLMPPNVHPADHYFNLPISMAIEWFQMTLKGGKNIPPSGPDMVPERDGYSDCDDRHVLVPLPDRRDSPANEIFRLAARRGTTSQISRWGSLVDLCADSNCHLHPDFLPVPAFCRSPI
jgi:pimeloyl-ACP methyl ester carboxylesterase